MGDNLGDAEHKYVLDFISCAKTVKTVSQCTRRLSRQLVQGVRESWGSRTAHEWREATKVIRSRIV